MSTDRYLGHIRHLRERLWVPGAHGRAAVLVGAGFSRNAQAVYADAPEFALLSNYVEEFARALGRDLNDAKFIPIDRLAEEYESSFGREALDDIIQRLIPWTSYRPGELHRKLLRLPWADIFTTNYDPLLEQARSMVPDRRYDLVVHPDDLPTARRPRILKLHGSFPSSRPFIFTEEDFRQYPQRFAPFVNAVQQGMLENTLCLIGFQGDDPNFLRWAGWIRDELGPHRPLIYLVNILNLNDARRRYLESRQIIPIDLGEILQFKDETPISERYRIANDWFLESLQNGRPEDLLDWPKTSKATGKINYIPAPIQPQRSRIRQMMSQDNYSPAQLYLYWRERRETYPRWEVFSAKNHHKLEYDSSHGNRRAVNSIQELTAPLNLLLLRELVWRHTLQNAPLEPALLKMVIDQLHIFMPSITHQTAVEGQLTADEVANLKIPAEWTPDGREQPSGMSTLRPIWIELAFAALTSHRLYLDVKGFAEWSTFLKEHLLLDHLPEWEAQWHWEGVRLSIDLLNLKEAESRIESWPLNPENPFWEIRRAAALAELGLIEKARGSFNSALERLRAGLLPGEPNPRLLSQFAWALRLRWFLNDWREEAMPKLEEGIEDKVGQWRLGIDTWADTEYWKSTLSKRYREVSKAAVKQEFRRKFDVGKGTRTFTVNSNNASQGDPLLALRFLRFLEWAGLPLMVDGRTFGAEELQPALLLLSHPYTYPLAVLVTIRTADANTLNGLMSRERIAALSDEHANLLFDTLFESIQQAISKAAGAEVNLREAKFHLIRHVLELGVEALSRLLLRASKEQVQEAFKLGLKLAGTRAVQLDWDFYPSVSSLITRTLDRWSPDQSQELVADLAAFPLPEGDRFAEQWPIPLHHPLFGTLRRETNTRWVPAPVVEHLIGLVSGGSDDHRRIASLTLYRLFEMNAINEKEAKRYGDALWQRVDERSKLPVHTGLYEFTVVDIPTSKGPEASTRFKNYYLENILFGGVLDSGVIRSQGGVINDIDDGLSSL
ncbi:SIR2 family NAD-dependent protein deacylase, partial [Deinococcus saxicola]